VSEQRTVLVPDGLAGERVDAAIARMFGLSRSRAAEIIGQGLVVVDGRPVAKSDRVHPGAMLEATIPAVADPVAVVPQIVEGIEIIHDDDSLVVVDRSGWPSTRAPAGAGRRWWGTWLLPASASRPAARASVRASCSAWTWARPGSW
jgi:23S rRNA-/tRNA-specific pseudouridylate synthase